MSDGLALRIVITLLGATQAGIAALLGFAEFLPLAAKIGLVVASASLAYVMNAVPSWTAAPRAARALKQAKAE